MGGDPYDSVVGVTLRDDMEFALRNLGYPSSERRDRIDEMVRFLEIGQIADRPIHTLSGGEQQQIALATGLVMEYSIMVLDESMNMLDHMNRSTLRKTLGVIKNRSGVAIVHATPDPIDLLEADELIFLDRACIAFKGGWLEFAQTEIGRGWFRALGGIWRIIGESASQGIFQTQPKTLEQIREILVNRLMSAGNPPKPLNK
jgi:energy-coupling factor transport system ATP-binding protein